MAQLSFTPNEDRICTPRHAVVSLVRYMESARRMLAAWDRFRRIGGMVLVIDRDGWAWCFGEDARAAVAVVGGKCGGVMIDEGILDAARLGFEDVRKVSAKYAVEVYSESGLAVQD